MRLWPRHVSWWRSRSGSPSACSRCRLSLRRPWLRCGASCGVEWVFSDAMSVFVLPRVELLPGRELAIAVMLPITVAFGSYL